ncbi:MAG: type II secretion system F family protein [Hyphomicrobiales bacterium]|nr:type II secretion system F family protein [Hyphomicrobiales bacterium]
MKEAFSLFINKIELFIRGETFLLALAYAVVAGLFLYFSLYVLPRLGTRRRVNRQLLDSGVGSRRALLAKQEAIRAESEIPVERYFEKIERGDPEEIEARLLRAGFYNRSALTVFYAIRLGCVLAAFLGSLAFGRYLFPGLSFTVLFTAALAYSVLFLFIPNLVLDRMAKRREVTYRRGFPDFMDLMIVCADAGMSLEAAVDRVSNELIYTQKALGIQLRMLTLEVRAGRTLREGLHNLAKRINTDEAKSLAILFQQSEELGTSLTQTLRVYSEEMREKRLVAAEEKANALPVKMVLPLGFCIFPVMMVMIMLPVIIRFKGVFL